MDEAMLRENKMAYIKMNLDKLDIEIEKLEADLEKADLEARFKMEDGLRRLKQKRDEACEQYEAMKQATGNSFEALRDSMVSAWRDLARGVESAKNSFMNSL